MNKYLKYIWIVPLVLAAGSCRSFEEKASIIGEGVTASVDSPVPGDCLRSKALDADFGFSFMAGDRITVFNGSSDEYMTYSLTPSKGMSDKASFNVEAFSLRDGLYYAVYPSVSSLSNPKEITLTLSGQHQEENNSTVHLSDYDYCLASSKIKDNSGYFKFEHKVCWLKIILPAGRNNHDFKKLSFSSEAGVATSVTLDARTGEITCNAQHGDAVSLELGTDGGLQLEASDTLVAYMCIPPGEYTDIYLTAESPDSYESVFRYFGKTTFESGKYYLARIGDSDIVPLQEITEYGIYDCDAEGRTMSWVPPVSKFCSDRHQISWYRGAGITSFDFFELGTTDFTSLRIDSENLEIGQDYKVGIVSSAGQICKEATFRLVRMTGNTAWLFDSADNLGCVIKIDE